jgi:hypothetical protein
MPNPKIALSKNPAVSPLTGSGNIVSKSVIAFDPSKYASFGVEAKNAHGEGWTPGEFLTSTKRVYTNPYDNALSQVQIPGDTRLGHIALIGNNNGYFDVAIRNADGKILNTPVQQAPYATAKQFISNQIKGRVDNIQSGKVASVKGDVVALK